MHGKAQTPYFIDGLYEKLIEGGVRYFFPSARFESFERDPASPQERVTLGPDNRSVTMNWLGSRCSLTRDESFSDSEIRLLTSIGAVLGARYRMIQDADQVEQRFELFRGLPEDRYVSAYLDRAPFSELVWKGPDRIEDAIEVLRTSSLSTYENRRISTGALLFGRMPDPCHALPPKPAGALRYSPALTSIRTFYRLCDGLQTLALVDENGFLAEIVDVEEWAQVYSDIPLPVPSAARYQTHSRATLCGGHVCMILTPNGEMKIIADGVQIFRFWDSRWRLTDAERKYRLWTDSLGNSELAECLFVAALNLAEERRGGLLVVLDDPRNARELVSMTDLVSHLPDNGQQSVAGSKDQLHYLLHQKRVLDVPVSVLETIARIDGAIVLDQDANLLAFGAILRHRDLADFHPENIEGGRTTAAIAASEFGNVLKVSEDGLISFFRKGECVWDI
jgi:DisA bacterial checkpoint controller nucleotide-binding